MFRFLALLVLVLSLTGCGFYHHLPMRAEYDKLTIGQPIPDDCKIPTCTTIHKDGVYAATWWNEWGNGTGTGEWIAVACDEQGLVIAKRYQVRGEELQVLADHYMRIDRSEWVMRIPSDQRTGEDLRLICAKLSFTNLGIASAHALYWDTQRFGDIPSAAEIDPWEMISAMEHDGALARREAFSRTSRSNTGPIFVSNIWKASHRDGDLLALSVEQRNDVSVSAATAYAYAQFLAGKRD